MNAVRLGESDGVASGTSPLDAHFARLAQQGRTAFVAYITAGHPGIDASVELMRGLEAAGVDILEIGVPFSDPLADGPVIQHSSQVAIDNGVTLARTLELVERAALTIPVVLFSYLNPLLAAGPDVLARAKVAGISAVLVTDLPVGSDPEREAWFGASGLDFVRLVAPTTPESRMAEITRHGGGFVYLISRLGVTGESAALSEELPRTIARLRSVTTLPICVGFGISTAEQARAAAEWADGVVVGSALVRAADQDIERAIALARDIRAALDCAA